MTPSHANRLARGIALFVFFLLISRCLLGLALVAFIVVAAAGLGGIAHPSPAHESRMMLGLFTEFLVAAACPAAWWYLDTRPRYSPMLHGTVLMAFALSLPALWFKVFGIDRHPFLWWTLLIGLTSIGVAVFVWRPDKVRSGR